MSMNIYFFSERIPDPNMVKDLGGAITAQFKGTLSDIHRRNNQIAFTEAVFLDMQTLNICHTIPAESIVVVEGSLLLQEPWLKAGITTLLIPQMVQKAGGWGEVLLKYCGLLQVHRIEVVTSAWTDGISTAGEKAQSQVTLAIKEPQ